jgi:uncharacterized membrane protein
MNQTVKLRPDGFRERGGEVTRIEAFVDAAFAFAMSMLVISVGAIPDSIPKLLEALKGTPAFAACFAQLAIFWYAHMTWSRRYGLDDRGSILLSLVLVFLVMVYIYPLKYMYASLFGWITSGWLTMGVSVRTLSDLRTMFIVYAVVFGTMSIVLSLLYLRAWRQRDALNLSLDERVGTIEHIAAGWVSAGVATASILIACSLREDWPQWMAGAPGMAYSLMFLNGPIPGWIGRRARARMLTEGVA